MQIGLHHHREQRLVHPPAPLQQLGKKLPVRSFGIRSSRSPAVVDRVRVRWPLRWLVRVSLRSCGRGADHVGELGLDQRLIDRFAALRTRSPTSADLSASKTSSRADWSRAIAWSSRACSLAGARRDSRDGPSHLPSHAAAAGHGPTPPGGTQPSTTQSNGRVVPATDTPDRQRSTSTAPALN